jgi:CrcB protein
LGENGRVRWVLLAAAGGALGAIGRAGVAELAPTTAGTFPWATLIVNVIGSVAIGVASLRFSPISDAWRFAVTGVIGGFTTFSAFANETRELLDADRPVIALVYVAATLTAGLLAVEIGFRATWTVDHRRGDTA